MPRLYARRRHTNFLYRELGIPALTHRLLNADKQRLQRAVAATDRKIDALAYELYGLTEEEIQIVESSYAR